MHRSIHKYLSIFYLMNFLFISSMILSTTLMAQERGFKTVPAPATPTPAPKIEKEFKFLYNKSHALIVGVSDYTNGWPDLAGVLKDVDLVKVVLEYHGFEVEVVMNPTKNEMEEAFSGFISRHGLESDNRLLFYFAGHGYTQKQTYGEEMGYIVPSDTPDPEKDLNGFLSNAMSMHQIEVYAKRIQSKHAMFLFDSCFSGSIFSITRAMEMPQSINYKISKPVRQFITSGGANEEVSDDSIFRGQFIAALNGDGDLNKDGFVTGAELGMFLQDSVTNYSHGMQHPQYGKIRHPILDKGDYLFPLPDSEQVKVLQQKYDIELKKLEEERKRWQEKREKLKKERMLAKQRRDLDMMEKHVDSDPNQTEIERNLAAELEDLLQLKKDLGKLKNTPTPTTRDTQNFKGNPDVPMCWDDEEFTSVPCGERGTQAP